MFYIHLCEYKDYDIVSMADLLVETGRANSRTEALRQLMREGMSHLSQTEIRRLVDPKPKINHEPEPEFRFMNPEIASNITDYKLLIAENKKLRGQLDMVANELQRANQMRFKTQLVEHGLGKIEPSSQPPEHERFGAGNDQPWIQSLRSGGQ